jgi:hypothetical protein
MTMPISAPRQRKGFSITGALLAPFLLLPSGFMLFSAFGANEDVILYGAITLGLSGGLASLSLFPTALKFRLRLLVGYTLLVYPALLACIWFILFKILYVKIA